MNPGGAGINSTVVTLIVVVLVVARFLARELRERTVRARTLWIRPAIFAVLMALLVAGAFGIPGMNVGVLVLSVLVGAAFGIGTGVLVVRSTTFAPSDEPGAVRARGNATTVIVWVAALLLRLAARYAFASAGADKATEYELNAGLVALVMVAFGVVAFEFHRAIDRMSARPVSTRTL